MKSRGVALVTGLLLLAAISLLAITAAGGMTLQHRQAANFQDRLRARSAAGAATRAAMAWLYSRPDSDRQIDCARACFLPDAVYAPDALPPQAEFQSASWWSQHATAADRDPVSAEPLGFAPNSAGQARWILQEVHFDSIDPAATRRTVAGIGYYRVLGRGVGRQAETVVVTETIVARPWHGAFEPLAFPPKNPLRSFCMQFDGELPCGMHSWRVLR
jgi:Tfp pilus assembly protein PilX